VGDAWQYEPAECFEVVAPGGAPIEYGRLARSNVAWENEFGTFRILADIEERDTRLEDISATIKTSCLWRAQATTRLL